jgi:Dolichyl-phosphate-mannose-protein mannosyltransferase
MRATGGHGRARITQYQIDAQIFHAVSLGGVALIVLVVHLAANGTLGFYTDELYYIDSGWHAALGYVDFPPIVPLLARLETNLLGATPWNVRLLPTLLGALMVALSGAYVRRLGGSHRRQALALLIAVTAPCFLGANWVYQTVTFDEATWIVPLYWFLLPGPRTPALSSIGSTSASRSASASRSNIRSGVWRPRSGLPSCLLPRCAQACGRGIRGWRSESPC